jgi:hypothetical protein
MQVDNVSVKRAMRSCLSELAMGEAEHTPEQHDTTQTLFARSGAGLRGATEEPLFPNCTPPARVEEGSVVRDDFLTATCESSRMVGVGDVLGEEDAAPDQQPGNVAEGVVDDASRSVYPVPHSAVRDQTIPLLVQLLYGPALLDVQRHGVAEQDQLQVPCC